MGLSALKLVATSRLIGLHSPPNGHPISSLQNHLRFEQIGAGRTRQTSLPAPTQIRLRPPSPLRPGCSNSNPWPDLMLTGLKVMVPDHKFFGAI